MWAWEWQGLFNPERIPRISFSPLRSSFLVPEPSDERTETLASSAAPQFSVSSCVYLSADEVLGELPSSLLVFPTLWVGVICEDNDGFSSCPLSTEAEMSGITEISASFGPLRSSLICRGSGFSWSKPGALQYSCSEGRPSSL